MLLQCVFSKIAKSYAASAVVLGCLCLIAPLASHASKVTVTVTGTAQGDDMYNIFGLGKRFTSQDFTLVITFDDAAARIGTGDLCAVSTSLASGSLRSFPATAVLTIGNGSYTYGAQPDSKWSVSRNIASSCSGNIIAFHFEEGTYPQSQGVDLHITPLPGKPVMTKTLDWHSPIAATEYDTDPRFGSFLIVRPHDFERLTKGYLFVKSVTVQ